MEAEPQGQGAQRVSVEDRRRSGAGLVALAAFLPELSQAPQAVDADLGVRVRAQGTREGEVRGVTEMGRRAEQMLISKCTLARGSPQRGYV